MNEPHRGRLKRRPRATARWRVLVLVRRSTDEGADTQAEQHRHDAELEPERHVGRHRHVEREEQRARTEDGEPVARAPTSAQRRRLARALAVDDERGDGGDVIALQGVTQAVTEAHAAGEDHRLHQHGRSRSTIRRTVPPRGPSRGTPCGGSLARCRHRRASQLPANRRDEVRFVLARVDVGKTYPAALGRGAGLKALRRGQHIGARPERLAAGVQSLAIGGWRGDRHGGRRATSARGGGASSAAGQDGRHDDETPDEAWWGHGRALFGDERERVAREGSGRATLGRLTRRTRRDWRICGPPCRPEPTP